MHRILTMGMGVFLILHGLIHLMGTTAYLKLAKIEALPYKTTILGGRWDIGDTGIRAFGALWLLPALGFVVCGIALAAGWPWWSLCLSLVTVVSLGLTVMDWSVAYAGALVNVVILIILWLGPTVSSWFN